MLKDMTLGQYFPGKSILHRLDPRMKLVIIVLYIVTVFLADHPACYAAALLSALLMVLISRISLKVIFKGLKPILFILLFTMLLNLFVTKGDGNPLFAYRFIKIYPEGVKRAILMLIRVVSLVIGTSVLLSYTTSPLVLTGAIEWLLSPLKKIKVRVHDFAMILTIALRFIPTLVEETERVMNAQKARGAAFDTGNLFRRAKALIPVIVPLLISSFGRADELATAMECRCYRGDVGRTRFVRMRFAARDFVVLFLFALFLAGVVVANIYLPPVPWF